MTQTPSDGGSATQTPPTPVTGNAPGGATPPAAALSLEEAMKRIADLEHSHGNATEELKRHRSKLSVYEKAEQEAEIARKAAEEAQLNELERAKKQAAELQAQHAAYKQQAQERIVRYEVERQAAKLGIIDPEAAAILILSANELEYGEDGTPTNADKLLEKLLKNKPYLAPAKPAEPPATPAQTTPPARAQTPALPAMNPGRTSIAQPGQTLPSGRPPRLADVWRKQQ